MINLKNELKEEDCRIYEVIKFLSYKWNTFIILKFSENQEKEISFSQLKKEFKKITSKALSTRLKDLEKNKVIIKKTLNKNNKKETSYKLTKHGKDLLPIILILRDWGKKSAPCKIEKNCNKCSFIKYCNFSN